MVILLSLPLAAKAAPTVLVFGDSLSAGYGLAPGQGWATLLAKRLETARPAYTVINASISGETSAGGRSRLPAALERFQPKVLILALGANDGLRGLPVKELRDNLLAMVRDAKAHRTRVLLVGMKLPPNYGPDYTRDFEQVFAVVAKQERTALLPFLLEPVTRDAYQADGLHPAAEAQAKIEFHVWRALRPLLEPY